MPTAFRSPAPFRRHSLSLLFGAALPSMSALAQAPDAGSSAALPAIEVTGTAVTPTTEGTNSYTTKAARTATGLQLSPRETPQSVSVVTRQIVEDQGLQTTGDMLNSATGISITRSDANRLSVSARGFAIDTYQFDGLVSPVLSPWAFGESNLDTAIYDRLEVVRGATGLMTGAGNPSAAINFVRKRPLREFAASAGVSVGSWNFRRAEADVSVPLTQDGRIRSRLVAAHSDGDSYTTFLGNRSNTFYGVLSADLTPATELTLGLSRQDTVTRGFGAGFPLFYTDGRRTDFDRSVASNTTWTRAETDTTTAFLDLTHRFANRWTARLAYSHASTDMMMKHLYRGGAVNAFTGAMSVAPSYIYYDGELKRRAAHATLGGPFRLLGRDHEFSLGWMRFDDRLDLPQYRALNQPPIGSFFDWRVDRIAEPLWSSVPSQADTMRARQDGAYAVGRFSLADPLHLIVGARVSNWKTDQNYFGAIRKYEHRDRITPYAGLLYDIDDTYTAYASYTSIFKPQNNRDAAGEILDPVTGKSFELGLKASYAEGRLNGAFALFQTRQDNLAEAIAGQTAGGVPNTQAYRAVAGAKVEGVDLELSGEIARGWNLSAGYTHFRARAANGTPINTGHPRSQLKIFSSYRLPGAWSALTVGAGVNWQGRAYETVMAPPVNRSTVVAQSGYALVSLMARYEIRKNVSATLNIHNLTDRKYYSQVAFFNQGWYGSPRNATLSLRVQY